MFLLWIKLGLVWLMLEFSLQNNKFTNLLYEKKGNISIKGIFDTGLDNECNIQTEKELEKIASAIWTIEALNYYQYLPETTIGLSLYGMCDNFEMETDEDDHYIGVLTTSEIYQKLTTSERFLNMNGIVHMENILDPDMLTEAVVQLLVNLEWMSVNAVISDSANVLKLFKEKASEEGVHTHNEMLINEKSFRIKVSSSIQPPVMVVIAAFANIRNLTEKVQDENVKLILTPTDFVFEVGLLDLPPNAIFSLPLMGSKPALQEYIKNSHRKDYFNLKPPAKGPLFIETAASVIKLLKPVKMASQNRCRNGNFHSERACTDFLNAFQGNRTGSPSQKSMKISPDDVEETLKVLKIEPSSNDEMFLYITSVINGNASEDLAIFQVFSLETKTFQPVLTMINDESLKDRDVDSSEMKSGKTFRFKLDENQMRNPVINLLQKLSWPLKAGEQDENSTFSKSLFSKGCDSEDVRGQMCQSLAINQTAASQTNDTSENTVEVGWRFLPWVSINTSLGFVGVTCTLSTMLFIIIRLCKDDILDGSPYFALILMVFAILMYVSSLPFHLEFHSNGGFICVYRKNGPPVIFAILFSLLLSRSVIMAFSEGDEFGNRVNGWLQSVLCFFMVAVQISITSQSWLFEKDNPECDNIYDKYKIIFTLGYDFLLLILLACVSPFIIRSKQSYKEGLLFSISVFFITVVWSAWICFYVLLPNDQKDAAVAIGLNSTASVLLFCFFIPETYFMAMPLVQDRALRPFSSLDRNILTDISNANFKSNQALNETTFGTITFKNSEMGLSNPNFLTSRSNESDIPIRSGNFTRETVIDGSIGASQPLDN